MFWEESNSKIDNLVIIDEANLNGLKQKLSIDMESRIDFVKLLIILLGINWQNASQCILVGRRKKDSASNFYKALEEAGIKLILPECDLDKGDIWDDIQIGKLLTNSKENYVKNIFLVSGDSDFCESLKILRQEKININITSIPEIISNEMQKEFNFIDLHYYKDFILYNKKEKQELFKYKINGNAENISKLNKINKILDDLKINSSENNLKIDIQIDLL